MCRRISRRLIRFNRGQYTLAAMTALVWLGAGSLPAGAQSSELRPRIAQTCTGSALQLIRLAPLPDLSGTWARRPPAPNGLGNFMCENLPAPPSLLELRLVSTQESTNDETDVTTFQFAYEGSLTNYQSFVRRVDCPPRFPACNNDGPATCQLQGSRFDVQGTLEFQLTPGTEGAQLTFCQDWVANFDGFAPGAEEDFWIPATAQLTFFPSQAGQCGFWGERCSEGVVETIGLVENEQNVTFLAGQGCLAPAACIASEPEFVQMPPIGNIFERVSGTPDRLDLEASLEAKLISNVPTDTDSGFDNVVEGAAIGVYLQKRRIAERAPEESDTEYEQRVLAELEGERAFVTIGREGGTFTFGEPGLFETPPISIFRLSNVAGKNVWEPAFYTLVVRNAQTEEIERDPDTDEPTGDTTTLLFGDTVVTNLPAGLAPFEIELGALTGLAAKKRIVDGVKAACSFNYTPPENAVSAYLADLMAGTIELTAERDEGLRRAVWSEIAVRDTARYAGQILPLAIDSLATLLAELFDDLVDFESDQIARGKARAKQLDQFSQNLPPGYKSGFKLDPLDAPATRYDQALARSEMLARRSMLASQIKKLLKTVRILVQDALLAFDVDPNDATLIATRVELGLKTILSGVQNGSVARASKPVIKQLIKESVKSMSDDLLDGSIPFSYCALTEDYLDESNQSMQAWNVKDQTEYIADRSAVTAKLAETGRVASSVVWTILHLQWAGELADLTEDVFSFLANGFKSAKVVEKLAQAAKYGTNLAAFVAPMVYVFGELPEIANEASHAAYGQPPSGATTPALESSSTSVAGAALVPRAFTAGAPEAPSGTALTIALFTLRFALDDDDFAAVDDAVWGGAPGSARVELERFIAGARGFEVAAQGLDPAAAKGNVLATLGNLPGKVSDFDALAQQLFDGVHELLLDVWTQKFTGPDDAAYLARRNQLTELTEVVSQRASFLVGHLGSFATAANNAGVLFQPALMVVSMGVESTATGSDLVSESPETLTVTARVRNVSKAAAPAATARLTLVSPRSSTVLSGGSDFALGMLAADDGVAGGGADEIVAQWTIQYGGDLTDELIYLTVDLLEGTNEPTSFIAAGGDRFTAVDPDLGNADYDRLPDDWEALHGLDPEVDDSEGDLDGDSLINFAELKYGTLPETEDTDCDGRTDGEEVGGGVSSQATDPLDPDTDDDGTPDGSDPDPLDPTAASAVVPVERGVPPGEPVVMLDATAVALDQNHPFALVHVTNAGGGILEWAVEVETDDADESIVTTSPGAGVSSTGDTLFVGVTGGYDFSTSGAVAVTLRVTDVSGAVPDEVVLDATVGAACSAGGYDVDGNGEVDWLTDGVLVMRRLFGFAGDALVTGPPGENAVRTAEQIGAHVDCIGATLLDPDGNGKSTPLTDGLLLLRYLFGARGEPLIAGAVGPGCMNCTAGLIEGYFEEKM